MDGEVDRLAPGDYVMRRRVGPITAAQIRAYAQATNDFNPIHVDVDFARRRGLRDVISHGPLLAGVIASEMDYRFGPGSLRSLDLKFVAPVIAGEELLFTARVLEPEREFAPPGVAVCHVSITTDEGAFRADGTLHVVPRLEWTEDGCFPER